MSPRTVWAGIRILVTNNISEIITKQNRHRRHPEEGRDYIHAYSTASRTVGFDDSHWLTCFLSFTSCFWLLWFWNSLWIHAEAWSLEWQCWCDGFSRGGLTGLTALGRISVASIGPLPFTRMVTVVRMTRGLLFGLLSLDKISFPKSMPMCPLFQLVLRLVPRTLWDKPNLTFEPKN